MSRSNVGKKLRSKRLKLDITQEEMAIRIGVRTSTISAYETGRISISKEMFDRIMEVK